MTRSVPSLKADIDVAFLFTVLAIYRLGMEATLQQKGFSFEISLNV